MPLKAVFLDFGGTLMDPETDRQAHLGMMRILQRRAGIRSSPEELLALYDALGEAAVQGLGSSWLSGDDLAWSIAAAILEHHGVENLEELLEAFGAAYWREHYQNLRLFPEAIEVLRALREWPIHLGMISDVDEDFLQVCLFAMPIEDFFDSITTSDEVGTAKPGEAIFLRALAKAGCKPSEAAHVGDSPERDAAGARKVGMRTILLSSSSDTVGSGEVVNDLWEAYEVLRTWLETA